MESSSAGRGVRGRAMSRPAEESPERDRCLVLISDDSPDNTELLRQSIEGDQMAVCFAADGEETLSQVEKEKPDILLLDLMLPKLDGFEVLKRLRATEATRDLPVIIVSARVQVDDIVQGLAMGANDYITKPFHPRIVKARVALHYQAKRSRDELKRVSKLKDEFLSITSHDLQNPVSTIISYCRWLLESEEETLTTRQSDAIRRIHKNGLFMHELIGDLLDLVRFEAGRMTLYCEKANIVATVEEAVERNRFAATDKSILLSTEIASDLPRLMADPIKIQRVLNNLISNGIKFSHPGASVVVRAVSYQGGVKIAVADTGQGIPPAEQGLLFRRFGQLSVRSTSGEKSTGLGLLIVKKIVDLHEGQIWVESEVGKGSTFTFFLPGNDREPCMR
jgi:signal transduction histidine kinase